MKEVNLWKGVRGLVESRDQKLSLKDKVGLGLFTSLRHIRIPAITHRNVCSLSSLKKRSTLIKGSMELCSREGLLGVHLTSHNVPSVRNGKAYEYISMDNIQLL